MATVPASGWRAFRIYLEMIKIEHSIFALPFALIGMMWAAQGWPGPWKFTWIVVAMVACRSAAMAFNRIADREIDGLNPRTQMRALPLGLLRLRQASLFFWMSCLIFIGASALLNPLALTLSPVALGVTLGYSMCKRFTPLSHFVLGLSLGIAPTAAWIGVRGDLQWPPVLATISVLFWTAGFDIIYSLQDVEFDRKQRLRSLPETIGRPRALAVSRGCHTLAIAFLAAAGVLIQAGPFYFGGVVFAAALLIYEQSLVRPDDLSRVNLAFFTLNGFVSMGVFLFALLDQVVRRAS